MRRLILVLLVAMMCLLLCGCEKLLTVDGLSVGYYTDKETGVQYVLYAEAYGCSITPRLNPDGSLYVGEVSD